MSECVDCPKADSGCIGYQKECSWFSGYQQGRADERENTLKPISDMIFFYLTNDQSAEACIDGIRAYIDKQVKEKSNE